MGKWGHGNQRHDHGKARVEVGEVTRSQLMKGNEMNLTGIIESEIRKQVRAAFGGDDSTSASATAEWRMLTVDGYWHFVGLASRVGDEWKLTNAKIIRRHTTGKGVGEAVRMGPCDKVICDDVGDMSVDMSVPVARVTWHMPAPKKVWS